MSSGVDFVAAAAAVAVAVAAGGRCRLTPCRFEDDLRLRNARVGDDEGFGNRKTTPLSRCVTRARNVCADVLCEAWGGYVDDVSC